MKVLVQWARKNPKGWEELDAKDWRHLPKRPIPAHGEKGAQDDAPGHLRNVNVQGLTCEGYDHISVEPIIIGNDEGVKLTTWNDDPDDYPIGERNAIVWTILPLAPDPHLGMAINTRQSCVRYCEGERYQRLVADKPQNTTVRPWSEFVTPAEESTRHGIWLDDSKLVEHVDKAPQHEWGWMNWCEHLPDSECETETEITHHRVTRQISPRRKLKEQRAQGRYRQAEHTITYYQRDTARAAGWVVATNENALEKTTAASGTQTVTSGSGTVIGWAFATPANEPGQAAWPNDFYHIQLNVTAISTGTSVGPNGGSSRAFVVLNSDLSSVVVGVGPDGGAATGTGLTLWATAPFGTPWDPSGEDSTSRYGHRIDVAGDSHGDAATLQFNTTDSYSDGPWTSDTLFAQACL